MTTLAHDEHRQQLTASEPRESIWSVSRGVKHVYFALFIVLFSAGTLWTVAQGVEAVAALWRDLASLAVTAAAALSMVITETGRYLMVLAAAFEEWREKRRQEEVARAVAERLREYDAEWDVWLQRRTQAEQRGEPFDEPSPSARRRAAEPTMQQ